MVLPFDLRKAINQSSDPVSTDEDDALAFFMLIGSLQEKLKADHTVKEKRTFPAVSVAPAPKDSPDFIEPLSHSSAYISSPYGDINLCSNASGGSSEHSDSVMTHINFISGENQGQTCDCILQKMIPDYANFITEDCESSLSWMLCISRNSVRIKIRRGH